MQSTHPRVRLPSVMYRTIDVDGHSIFYREAGSPDRPTLLLLHGFPTSSHMFQELIAALSSVFHLVAPDYPGFGNSTMPSVDDFDYTFDNLAHVIDQFTVKLGLKRYSLYLTDYGAPIGFRLATQHPERIESLIIQNGNAYAEGINNDFWEPIKAYWKNRKAIDEGLDNDWWKQVKVAYSQTTMANEAALRFLLTPEATHWQYTHGVHNIHAVNPDNWMIDQQLLTRPGNADIQLQLLYDYRSNPPLYPSWHTYFQQQQPRTLLLWGVHDEICPVEGANLYRRDLTHLKFHLLDTGHFALEEEGDLIAQHICDFLVDMD